MTFKNEDIIYGSSFDIFQEVIVEEEGQEINVDNSRSNSPLSVANDMYSNENSLSSFCASEPQNKYWTREDLTPSEVLPENLFTENEDDMSSFQVDSSNLDPTIEMKDDPGLSFNNLFSVKEESCETEDMKPLEIVEENTKRTSRRKAKQDQSNEPPKTK